MSRFCSFSLVFKSEHWLRVDVCLPATVEIFVHSHCEPILPVANSSWTIITELVNYLLDNKFYWFTKYQHDCSNVDLKSKMHLRFIYFVHWFWMMYSCYLPFRKNSYPSLNNEVTQIGFTAAFFTAAIFSVFIFSKLHMSTMFLFSCSSARTPRNSARWSISFRPS